MGPGTQVTGNPTYQELATYRRANRVRGLLPVCRLSFKWGCVALLRLFYAYPNRIRFYDPEELVSAIRDTGIDFLLCRASLFSLVAIFEAALDRMNARLAKLGYLDPRRVRRVAL